MMQRNEVDCLEPWLRYHGHIFGYENLFVIDHGSDEQSVLATLNSYQLRGVRVRPMSAAIDFKDKGKIMSAALCQVDALGVYDLLLPLDCDEFVVMRDETGAPSCDRDAMLAYMAALAGETAMLQVTENFLNTLGHPGIFFALPYQKVFFTRGGCGFVDEGAHWGGSPRSSETKATRLVYVHFHHKRYATLVKMSREKLRAYIDVDDPVALETYRGIGWHLVTNLRGTEADYMSIMTPGGLSITFPALVELFLALGIDPMFCD